MAKYAQLIFVFALGLMIQVFCLVEYYSTNQVSSCYEGNVTLTESNIELLSRIFPGSCTTYLGLVKVKCPQNSHGCFVSSTNPSHYSPSIGDNLSFGCLNSNVHTFDFKCFTSDNGNCFECNDYLENSESPIDPRCDIPIL